MKQMKYQKERKIEILKRGAYNGYEYLILSLGTHPCAYINLDNKDFIKEDDYIGCHCGITFYQKGYTLSNGKRIFNNSELIVGWDYAHSDDKFGDYDYGIIHTTEEIYAEVKEVIDNIKKIEKGVGIGR